MLWELIIASLIVSVCVVVHISGLMLLMERLMKRRTAMEQNPSVIRTSLMLITIFAVIITLHMIETTIWAGFYYWRDLFPDFETSLYFSLTSFSTMGFGDVVLPQKWRLLGGLEGISGVLLCGLSGAFIFVIVSTLIHLRAARSDASK